MQETCSCGTQLVEGALFCHRCGKAQRALLEADFVEPVAAAPLPPPPPEMIVLPAIGFNNSIAVRLCFVVASVAAILDATPILNLFFLIWSATAGFVAVVLYRRATGITLTIAEGARLGWITGVLNSLVITVVATIYMLSDSTQMFTTLREQARIQNPNDPSVLAMIDSPYFLAVTIVLGLFVIFFFLTAATVAGGALGARILRDDRAPGHQSR